jgi:molybdopterin-containing oxidoreductase family iron-sulfur binding subunit
MSLADIKARLDGLEGRTYWRSLEELADTPEFREYVGREFPAQASEFTDPAGRRDFLKLMGASLALAGVSACTRQPEEHIVPYVRQPEEVVPGRPLFYATAMPQGGFGSALLAENHMGRPTKLEGNPDHPASLGGTDMFGQAAVLGLYDPDRSRTILNRGEVKTWSTFLISLQALVAAQRGIKGAGLRLLTDPITSPTLTAQIKELLASLPDARWHQWDAVYGARQGGAAAAHAIYKLDKADVVVSLDADFLGFGPGCVRYAKDFSSRRRMGAPTDEINRLYVVEPVPTVTGSNADHRLSLKSRDVHAFAAALAGAAGAHAAAHDAPGSLSADATKWAAAIGADLVAHKGRAVVVAGEHQPAAVHAIARAINDALGNTNVTVLYTAPLTSSPADGAASLAELVAEMNAGKVDALVILGDSNPVFTAPADLKFTEAMAKVGNRIHLGLYNDETGEQCHWHVPQAHFLESWGDVRAFDGTVSLIQPLIAPLYDGRTALEVLSAMNGTPGVSAMDLVKDFWTQAFGSTEWKIARANGQPFANAESFWKNALHDGFVSGTSMLAGAAVPAAPAEAPSQAPQAMTGIEIIFRPDPNVLDGRFANHAWLQELPKPLSKVTWDNVAYISAKTADGLGIPVFRPGNTAGQPVLEIGYQGRTVRLPVWVLPGTADDTVVVHLGYGRKRAGRVGTGLGVDVFPIRTSKAPWFDGGATVVKTNETYPIASTQNHFLMEGRNPVRVVELEEFRATPQAVAEMGPARPDPALSLYPEKHPFEKDAAHRWGMAIDLNACTGCGVCVAACVAENNIAVVGKDQVMRSREMHWLRVDTYFEGDVHAPVGTYHQPLPCMQCENAPCEVVCPVAATVHSDEGLNDMVYNRCVGTRYCSNNCPYKVRRFNFFLYSDFVTPELYAQRNPDVTIRSRGVMEKCTYCVQRINHARIDAKTAGTPIADGAVQTACQQACPADAIVLGDLNDAGSKVTKLKAQTRNYGLLEDLGTRPRTTYLAVVRNPNPGVDRAGQA